MSQPESEGIESPSGRAPHSQPAGPTTLEQAREELVLRKNTVQEATRLHLADATSRANRHENECRRLQEELDELRPRYATLKASLDHLTGLSVLSMILFAVGSGLISSSNAFARGSGWAFVGIGVVLSLYGVTFVGAVHWPPKPLGELRRKLGRGA